MDVATVEREVQELVVEIERLGTKGPNGKHSVKFGTLFDCPVCANKFEALNGTLRAAKKRGVIDFEGEILLQGVHNDVDVRVV